MVFISLKYIPGNGIARLNGRCLLSSHYSLSSFMEVERLLPPNVKHFIFPSSLYEKTLFSTSLPAINLTTLFKCFARLMRVKSFLLVNLILISMTTSKFQYLFIILLTVWIYSDMKSLFMLLPIVFSWIIFLYL